jgi:hypothetical protein
MATTYLKNTEGRKKGRRGRKEGRKKERKEGWVLPYFVYYNLDNGFCSMR